jgi:hypothetical protein
MEDIWGNDMKWFGKEGIGDKRALYLFGLRIPYKRIKNNRRLIKELRAAISETTNLYLAAMATHPGVFGDYKSIYKEREIVILGSGPSANKYRPINDAIHIGVNRAFRLQKVMLDYLFIQDRQFVPDNPDYIGEQEAADTYGGNNCQKFYGRHYEVLPITEASVDKANAKRFIFHDRRVENDNLTGFSSDITVRPLNEWGSVIFAALDFALWTHPKRIYIVGCDCSNNGSFDGKCESYDGYDGIVFGWKQYARYIENYYPDVEVVSVNPVGLKGLFADRYTDDAGTIRNDP